MHHRDSSENRKVPAKEATLVSLGDQRQPWLLEGETTEDKESNLSLHIWTLLK